MRIGVNIGHIGSEGAIGYLNELQCNKEVANALTPLLEQAGHEVIQCSVADPSIDYVKSTHFANTQNLDLLISIHFNAASESAHGTEVLHYPNSSVILLAQQVCDNISNALGTTNRGLKPVRNIYIIGQSNCKAMLIEGLFVTNKEDCDKYNAKVIAKAIAECFGYTEDEEKMKLMGKTIASAIVGHDIEDDDNKEVPIINVKDILDYDANDLVWEFSNRNIITNKELWLDKLNNDIDLICLLRKVLLSMQ
jgi:N-acetylmuramoyl-L-alanine amidase